MSVVQKSFNFVLAEERFSEKDSFTHAGEFCPEMESFRYTGGPCLKKDNLVFIREHFSEKDSFVLAGECRRENDNLVLAEESCPKKDSVVHAGVRCF